ncbi:MAG: glucosamine--fructose-6-phosphate aminotransferase (isomerizing) [Candidatus Omnitrophota bacterium]|jgi:glucosamine--fructose-6-phosphate aminotransferase (isomerizing)
MCGIFGYIGPREAAPILIQGLKRLEYRGYDSAGIAVLNGNGRITLKKKKGKVKELESFLGEGIHGGVGIGHTRWATHGMPNDINSHPHMDSTGEIAIIHNGIIENYAELKKDLQNEGINFLSETDSEVIAHLVSKFYSATSNLKEALRQTTALAEGSYSIGVIHAKNPGRIVAIRHDSPLVIGLGDGENFIASDLSAILEHTHKIINIENGEIVELDTKSIHITDVNGKEVKRPVETINWDIKDAEKQGYEHFMLKEIFEQPKITANLLDKRIRDGQISFDELKISPAEFKRIQNISIVACGSSYHAGLVGRYVFEELESIPVAVDMSSEFRYRKPSIQKDTLVIVISQSGETADTLAALREAKSRGALTLAICNVLGSSIEREADGVIYTLAGPEIAVASTKAYTAQITLLYLLAFYIRSIKHGLTDADHALLQELHQTPKAMAEALEDYKNDTKGWAENAHRFNTRYHEQLKKYFNADLGQIKRAPNALFLFLGRNVNFPSALEGALKLKEIAYISAEGYAAGEMKHGPIALIDENPWVICIGVESATYDKMVSNIQEITARGGIITAIVTKGDKKIKALNLFIYIEIPKVKEIFSPLVVAIPLQLIAYSVAKEFNEEIDQPRNLAKSVTVE